MIHDLFFIAEKIILFSSNNHLSATTLKSEHTVEKLVFKNIY